MSRLMHSVPFGLGLMVEKVVGMSGCMQVFLVESNAKREDLKLQEEEVCDAMFVNHRELAQLYSHMTDIDKQIYTEAVSPMLLDGLQ